MQSIEDIQNYLLKHVEDYILSCHVHVDNCDTVLKF